MKISTVYQKGNRDINEDAIVVDTNKNIFAVIDGATGLGGLPGSLASGIIKESLEKDTPIEMKDKIIEGNIRLRAAAESNYGEQLSLEQIPKHKRSSCGLAAIKINKNPQGEASSIDFISAADCMLFLQFSDSSIRQITFDHIDKLDGVAISTIQKAWCDYLKIAPNIEDISIEKQKQMHNTFRENVQEMFQTNRNKLNTLEGYGIIDGDPPAEHYLEFGHIPLISVRKILLLSDGLKLHTHRESENQETWF